MITRKLLRLLRISLLLLTLEWTDPISAASSTKKQQDASSRTKPAQFPYQVRQQRERLAVKELTAETFDSNVLFSDSVWLIEFFAPWCSHCTAFADTYQEIADAYHGRDDDDSKKKKKPQARSIEVARVDGSAEQALSSRFNVGAFPTFFIVDGFSVYEYDQPRSKEKLMAFAEGGYKKQAPIPFYASPMGPMGLLQGGLIVAGVGAAGLFRWTQSTLHLTNNPVATGIILFGLFFVGMFMTLVFLAIAIPPKLKQN